MVPWNSLYRYIEDLRQIERQRERKKGLFAGRFFVIKDFCVHQFGLFRPMTKLLTH